MNLLKSNRCLSKLKIITRNRSLRSQKNLNFSEYSIKAFIPCAGWTVGLCGVFEITRRNFPRRDVKNIPWDYIYLGITGPILLYHYTSGVALGVLTTSPVGFSQWWTWLTHGFNHSGFIHWICNTVGLNSFFHNSGTEKLLLTEAFLIAIIWGGFFWALFQYFMPARIVTNLGASGGVFGVIGYKQQKICLMEPFQSICVTLPNSIFKTFGIPYQFPTALSMTSAVQGIVGISCLFMILQLKRGRGVVGHAGHMGGLLAGYGLNYYHKNSPSVKAWNRQNFRLPKWLR